MDQDGSLEEGMPRFLTVQEIAKILKVNIPTARNLILSDGFPGLVVSKKKVVVSADQFNKWVVEQSGKKTDQTT